MFPATDKFVKVPTVVMLLEPVQVLNAVFSTLPNPTIDLLTPPTVPVKVGSLISALTLNPSSTYVLTADSVGTFKEVTQD
jgi:hypothetical protein